MRRLIYAPRAHVFIRSDTQTKEQGKTVIYDVSDDVVSGSVERNINTPSKAEVVLRNRFRKWIRHPDNGKPLFLPMDMITIWLTRIAGKPIQVFTGYLDSVPYYQMYPANCTIAATCTLKRLAIRYFDPGLEMFTQMVSSLGWTISPATGEAINTQVFADLHNGVDLSKPIGKTNDGGFAELLYKFMVEIAGWTPSTMLIANLPPDLPKRAAKLYTDINRQTEKDLAALEVTMNQIMGLGFTTLSTQNGLSRTDPTSLPPKTERLVKVLKEEASKKNIPLVALVAAAIQLSAFDEHYRNTNSKQATYGFGLFAAKPDSTVQRPGHVSYTFDGHTENEIFSPDIAAQVFIKRLIQVDVINPDSPGNRLQRYSDRARRGDSAAIQQWIEAAVNRPLDDATFQTSLNFAVQYVRTWNTEHLTNDGSTLPPVVTPDLTWNSPSVQALIANNARDKAAFTHYSSSISELAVYYYYAKTAISNKIELSWHPNMPRNVLALTADSKTLDTLGQALSRVTEIDVLTQETGRTPKVWRNGTASNETGSTWTYPNSVTVQSHSNAPYPQSLVGNVKSVKAKNAAGANPDLTDVAQNGLNFEQFATLSLDAAFTAQFAFPTNYIESHFLTGHKALANDIPCLDAVDQFCKASMRSYMSLPDGRFLAFYPDYFAHNRAPYWMVHDIEIKNAGIQLNDESLATHVYVVGDTFGLDGQIDEFDTIGSRGVVTLDMAGVVDSFVTPSDHEKAQKGDVNLGDLKTAYEFLAHYGARPFKEEQPLIRNSFFEFLMAFQRFMQLWASQFATTIDFTFQPEIMAGGIVHFAVHDIYMYVEQVTHTWDYASGFDTTARMTAPSTPKKTGPLPGFALAGGVNSVGTAD